MAKDGEQGGAGGGAVTLDGIMAAVQSLGANLNDKMDKLKEVQIGQADLLDQIVGRVEALELAEPAPAPMPGGAAGLLPPDLERLQQDVEDLKLRPAGQETAEQVKLRYERELRKESDRKKQAAHRQFIHFDPEWCNKQDPPVALVRNVEGTEQAEDAERDGYYPTLRKAAEAGALAAALRIAQDKAEAELLRSKPDANDAEIRTTRLNTKVKPPPAADVQKHMQLIHRAVGKVGHEGWQKQPAA